MPDPTITIRYCVICDDVRLEVANKETIIGVYTVGMSVPVFPWVGTICLWMPIIWSGEGQLDLEVRVINPANEQIGIIGGRGTAVWAGLESTLTFRGLTVTINMDGVHSIEWRAGSGSWQRIRQ